MDHHALKPRDEEPLLFEESAGLVTSSEIGLLQL